MTDRKCENAERCGDNCDEISEEHKDCYDPVAARAQGVIRKGNMRKELTVFADLMEHILKENDYKPSWKKYSRAYLMERLGEEYLEFVVAVATKDKILISKEAADVANFAMMVSDKYGNPYLSQLEEENICLKKSREIHQDTEEDYNVRLCKMATEKQLVEIRVEELKEENARLKDMVAAKENIK